MKDFSQFKGEFDILKDGRVAKNDESANPFSEQVDTDGEAFPPLA